jgi:hypothetical protein
MRLGIPAESKQGKLNEQELCHAREKELHLGV